MLSANFVVDKPFKSRNLILIVLFYQSLDVTSQSKLGAVCWRGSQGKCQNWGGFVFVENHAPPIHLSAQRLF